MEIKVWEYLKKYRLQLTSIVIFSILTTISGIIVPYLNGNFIDVLISSGSLDYILRFAAVIIIIGILGAVASYFVNMSTAKMTANTSFDMLSDAIGHVQRIPYDVFTSRYSPAYLIQRMTGDLNTMFSFFLNNFMNIFLKGITFIIVLAIVATINLEVFLVSLLFLPIYLICYIALKKPMFERNREYKERSNHYTKTMFEQINRLYEIKVEATFKKSVETERKSFAEYLRSLISFNRISYLFTSLDGIIAVLFQSVILVIGGIQIINGEMSIGEFTIVNTYFTTLLACTKYYFNLGKSIQDYRSSKTRMEEILNIEEENNGSIAVEDIDIISVSDVSYTYNPGTTNVINNLNITFRKGEITLVRGPNGVGKTTSVNIILGILQNLNEGVVEYNGIDIQKLDIYSARENCISTLIQSTNYPDQTVGDYLKDSLGLEPDGIIGLIKLLELDSIYINDNFRISDYWDVKINNLSGGQKQRVILLKVLGKNNSVMILDEPSTGLDGSGTESLIRYLSKSKNRRITIIISHDTLFENISDEVLELSANQSLNLNSRHVEVNHAGVQI